MHLHSLMFYSAFKLYILSVCVLPGTQTNDLSVANTLLTYCYITLSMFIKGLHKLPDPIFRTVECKCGPSFSYLCIHRGTVCNVVISQGTETGRGGDCGPPIIFNPDFFVEKLRHEQPEAFTELVLSNITRLIDLPGAEFSQLQGDEEPKTPTSTSAGGFFRSFNFLKRKGHFGGFGKCCYFVFFFFSIFVFLTQQWA